MIGTKIYVFGGTWTDEDDNTIYMNDLHVLDVSNFSWARPVWSGTPPIEREGHTASVVGRRVFVFAGTWVDDEHNSVYLNHLHVLDTSVDAMAWTQPSTSGEAPCQFSLVADGQTVRLEAESEAQMVEWMEALQERCASEKDAKSERKMGHNMRRRMEMEERRKEAEKRKAAVLATCQSKGMVHTAQAMMNRG